jgi:diguanylate cyclase (GGDEF)-like protein/PAS domain S-box-containing protein
MAQLSVLPRSAGSPARAERSRIRFQDFGLYGIAALGLIAIALIWLGAGQFIREDQRRAEESAALSAANLARAFEDHTLRSLRAIDQLLLFARASYRKGPAGFDLAGWLQQQNFITDIAVELSVIDADGLLVASSAPSAAPRMDLGHREYFLTHAGTERDELFISAPTFGQATRKWWIHLTRRITGADGAFAGIVMITIDPAALSRFSQAIDVGRHGAIDLVGTDGIIRAHAAPGSEKVGQTIAGSALFTQMLRAGAGTSTAASPDGLSRISGFRRVTGYPLFAIVGLARDEMLADLAANRSLYLGSAAALSLMILIFTIMILRHQVGLQRTRDELRASEAQYRSVVNGIAEVIFETDETGCWTFLNRAWTDVTGHPVAPSLHRPAADFLHVVDRPGFASMLHQVMRGAANAIRTELRVRTAGDEVRWIAIDAAPRRNTDGDVIGIAGTLTDVTERHDAETALRNSEIKFRSLFDLAPVGVALTDQSGRFLEVNRAFADMTGYSAQDAAALVLEDLLVLKRRSDLERFHTTLHDEGRIEPTECGLVGKDGARKTVLVNSSLARDAEGGVLTWSIIQDISERKRDEMKIWQAANFDTLTGLCNRSQLHEAVDDAIAEAARRPEPLALMLIDLDNFKLINDTLGHEAGDLALRRTADRLRRVTRDGDLVARLSGDEFAVFLRKTGDPAELERKANEILRALRRKTRFRGEAIEIHGSIGIATFPEHGESRSELFRSADLALYRAKHDGRNCTVFYDPAMRAKAAHRYEVLTTVRDAIHGGRVVAVYQPQMLLGTGAVDGLEALVRIEHDDGKLTLPGEFMSAFEDAEVGRALGLQMLDRVTRDFEGWLTAGIDVKRIAINVSNMELRVDDYAERVMARLRQRRIPFEKFEIEVTETVIFDEGVPAIRRNLRTFAENGISLALDDFGTGFASLTHLKSLPVSRVKIDDSFIRHVVTDPQSRSIVDAIVRLSHSLGKPVVAEGVEDAEQLERIRELRCESAQGYLFARPLRAEEVPPFLLRNLSLIAKAPRPREEMAEREARIVAP